MYALIAIIGLQGCSNLQTVAVATTALEAQLNNAYDYALINRNGQSLSLNALANTLENKQVVFIGEYHSNHASHFFEMALLEALHQRSIKKNTPVILSMEMFHRDQQAILNDYLAGKIGERYLIEEAPAWKNYKAAYRPLVEYAKQHGIPIVAANAPEETVRCIGRQGEAYVEKLKAKAKLAIAQQPFADIPGYKEKFFGLMGDSEHTPSERMQQSYLAQISRDNTMAESIAFARKETPNSLVIHINGTFHSEGSLGSVAALKRLQPNISVSVVSPLHHSAFIEQPEEHYSLHLNQLAQLTQEKRDDFYYVIRPQPEEFVDEEYMRKTHQKMFSTASEKADTCQ